MKKSIVERNSFLAAVVLRSVFSFVLVIVFCMSTSAQEMDVKSYFERMSKGIEISCESLAIYRYKGQVSVIPTHAREVKVDVNGCERVLQSTNGNRLLRPLLDIIESSVADDLAELNRLTEDQKENKIHDDELKQKQIVGQLRARAKSLIETCRKQGMGAPQSQNKICYFGAPNSNSGSAFKDAFEAMARNTLPQFRSLCAPDPITKTIKIENEFKRIQKSETSPISCNEIRQSIEKDGFVCPNEARCTRWILQVNLPSSLTSRKLSYKSVLGYSLFLRNIEMHGGENHTIGPPSFCRNGTDGGCISDKPERGTKSGICMASEDWHVWGHIQTLLNYEAAQE